MIIHRGVGLRTVLPARKKAPSSFVGMTKKDTHSDIGSITHSHLLSSTELFVSILYSNISEFQLMHLH